MDLRFGGLGLLPLSRVVLEGVHLVSSIGFWAQDSGFRHCLGCAINGVALRVQGLGLGI